MEKLAESSEKNVVVPDEPKRGFWLSAFLVLMMVSNPITAYVYFSNPEIIIELYPKATVGLLYCLAAICLSNVVIAALIWRWKKVAVYSFYVVVVVAFVINVFIGVDIIGSVMGVLGAVFVHFLTKKSWSKFS